MDLRTLISRMNTQGDFDQIAGNRIAQFGSANRRYIGAEILPEKNVDSNALTEEFIRFRSIIANASTRYSPAQKKGGQLAGNMSFTLAESDIAGEFNARMYDGLRKLLGSSATTEDAMASVVNFVDLSINVPLIERNEAWRWQALVLASVSLLGDNNYTETVTYTNPSGNRAAIGAPWSTTSTDPFLDIYGVASAASAKGLRISRIITSTATATILGNNPKVQARVGNIVLPLGGGGVSVANRRGSLAQINTALAEDSLPAIERYDLQYRTETGTVRFLPTGVMVFICDVGRDPVLDLGDMYANAPEVLDQLNGVVGYLAVGRAAGMGAPGRAINVEAMSNKPPRVQAQGWQTSLPIIIDPDAVFVLTGIT